MPAAHLSVRLLPMATNEYAKYLDLKSAIEDLFGSEAWYALKESNHVPTWRKYAEKTLEALNLSSKTTIEVFDESWRQEFDQLMSRGVESVRKCQAIDEIVAVLAGTLVRIAFLQIGQMPSRRGTREKVTLRSHMWRLDSFRSVMYVQNPDQKDRQFWAKQQRQIGVQAQLEMHRRYNREHRSVSDSGFE